jgi:SAM-dependent methyltransferase
MTETTAKPATLAATERAACGACGGDGLYRFLDLGMSPVAGDFPTVPEYERMAPRFPLRLAVCQDCTLVQLVDIIPGEILYGRDYPYYSGASAPVVMHMMDYAAYVMANFPRLLRDHGVLEIAANDGTLLRHFARAGFRTLGVEPATGPAAYAAAEHGLNMVVAPFGESVGKSFFAQGQRFGVIIANNVLAHVEDLGNFLEGVRYALQPDGVAIFEVQYLPDLLLGNAFDLVYHEHRSFFSLTALRALFASHGLTVCDVKQHEMQGGSIRVVARHAGPHVHPEHSVNHLLRAEAWLGTSGTTNPFSGVQGRVNRIRDRLRTLLAREGSRTVVGYAASAKATTLLSFVGLDVDRIAYMVDTTPVKWGRYMPGTSIPILDPTEAAETATIGGLRRPDTYLLTVGNYLPATLRREAAFLAAGGRIISPLPVPTII